MRYPKLLRSYFVSVLIVTIAFGSLGIVDAADEPNSFAYDISNLVQQTWHDDYFGSIVMKIGDTNMVIDGETRPIDSLTNIAPLIENGRTLLPVAPLASIAGVDVTYDAQQEKVTLTEENENQTIEFFIGQQTYYVNGQAASVNVAPFTMNGRTMLPLRDVAENLGFEPVWVQETQEIILTKPYQTKRLIVWTNGQPLGENYGAISVISIDNKYVLQYATETEAKEADASFKRSNYIVYSEPDSILLVDNLQSAAEANKISWGTTRIGADLLAEQLDKQPGKQEVIVAVLDTGLDINHSFFEGRICDIRWNFIDWNGNPYDDHSHGTHVSGTVVDATPENVKIMPVKVLNNLGYGTSTQICEGIKFAAENGADVINLSLSGRMGESLRDYQFEEAIDYAVAKNTVVVVAAGNKNADTKYFAPAYYDKAITVAATDNRDQRASFSNFGQSVDLAAPGVYVNSAVPGGGYSYMDGTSMAAPHVSASVAILKTMDKSLSPAEVSNRLREHADNLGAPGWNAYYGAGLVDVRGWLEVSPREEINPPKLEPTLVGYRWSEQVITLNVGEAKSIQLFADYSDGTSKDVTSIARLYSEDESIAHVNLQSLITGKSAGNTAVSLLNTLSPAAPPPIRVIISAAGEGEGAITGYRWSEQVVSLQVGETKAIKLFAEYSDGTSKDITQTAGVYSTDETIAIIDGSGNITGKKIGNAGISFRNSSTAAVPPPVRVLVEASTR